MTEVQRIQFDRFIAAGYTPEDAAMLVDRGAWLGTDDISAQTVADIKKYRRERDARGSSAVEGVAKGGRHD